MREIIKQFNEGIPTYISYAIFHVKYGIRLWCMRKNSCGHPVDPLICAPFSSKFLRYNDRQLGCKGRRTEKLLNINDGVHE
jgi:hypothetical protein